MSLTRTVTTLAHDLAQDAAHAADEVKKAAVDIVRQVPLPVQPPRRRGPSPVQWLLVLVLGAAAFAVLRRRRRAADGSPAGGTSLHAPSTPTTSASTTSV